MVGWSVGDIRVLIIRERCREFSSSYLYVCLYIIFVLQFVCHSWFMASYNIIVCSNVEHTSHLKYTFASCHSRYIDSSHTEIVRIGSMDVNKGYVVVYTLHTPFTDTGVDYCIPSL